MSFSMRDPAEGKLIVINETGLILELHSAICIRKLSLRICEIYYLSLFDVEIEHRIRKFTSSLRGATRIQELIYLCAYSLPLTDSIILICKKNRAVVCRGGSSNFPLYWRNCSGRLCVSTSLPLGNDREFSLRGLACSIAVVSLQGPYEPNFTDRCPLSNWRRMRRASISTFQGSRIESVEVIKHGERYTDIRPITHEKELITNLRLALDCFAETLESYSSLYAEISGGFDSTVAFLGALKKGFSLSGVSVIFPYYEFRYEDKIQQKAASKLNINRKVLDGELLLPYAPAEWKPRLGEPAITVTGLKNAIETAKLAKASDAECLLVGHGGDQVFSANLFQKEHCYYALDKGAFSDAGWRRIKSATSVITSDQGWLDRATGCFVYDARLDLAVKSRYGVVTRTPFSDLEFFLCGIMWSLLTTEKGRFHDKKIIEMAFGDVIPRVIKGRKGKAPYDGVWSRAYVIHKDNICAEIDKVITVLEHIGFSPKWLIKRIEALSLYKPVSDREVLSAYAVSTWLSSWDITVPSDVKWND